MDFPARKNNLYKEHIIEDIPEPEPVPEPEWSPGCSSTLTAGQGTFQFCTQPSREPGYIPPRRFQFDTNVENLLQKPKWLQWDLDVKSPMVLLLVALVLFLMYRLFRA